jgi:rubrerythrin
MEIPHPSFYAVIPASVRYDKALPNGARLLFGEISSLCNKEGYCWAGNAYFSELYQTSERTITNWINALKDNGHISVSYSFVSGKKEIESRLIRINSSILPENLNKNDEKTPDSEEKEVVKKISIGGENNFSTCGKNFQEVVKKISIGGEKNFADNIKNNIKITATAASDPPEPLPTVEKAAAAETFTPQDLKNALSALDKRLFFDREFYPRAADYLSEKGIDFNFLPWLHEKCESKNPSSFGGLYYKLFFELNVAEEYIASLRDDSPPEPPPLPVVCPVCGNAHAPDAEECPECSLPKYYSEEKLLIYRQLYGLPLEKRNDYFNREEAISVECGSDFAKRKEKISQLKKEFNLPVI